VYGSDDLVIEVDNDGPGGAGGTGSPPSRGGIPGGRPPGGNSGVAGMTERARALGGTLTAGPRQSGGFQVLARLPT